jgi:hypothetical protein
MGRSPMAHSWRRNKPQNAFSCGILEHRVDANSTELECRLRRTEEMGTQYLAAWRLEPCNDRPVCVGSAICKETICRLHGLPRQSTRRQPVMYPLYYSLKVIFCGIHDWVPFLATQ